MATTQRVAERCTSISNVIGKNYQVSGKLNLLAYGIGGGWSQSGVQLSAEAAERQIQMDRLCRAWAVGAISDEKWSDVYVQFALASIAPLARSEDPAAKEQLVSAEKALRVATEELANLRADSTYKPDNDAARLKSGINQVATSGISLEQLHKALDEAFARSGLNTASDTKGQPGALEIQMAEQQRVVLEALGAIKARVETVELKLGGPGPGPVTIPGLTTIYRNWQEKGGTKVYFAVGKSNLSAVAKQALDGLFTGAYPRELRVEVMGYADKTGNPQKNAALSIARAEEVRDYLIFERKVPASSVVSLGRQQGVSRFGEPAENRVVTVRIFEDEPLARPPSTVSQGL